MMELFQQIRVDEFVEDGVAFVSQERTLGEALAIQGPLFVEDVGAKRVGQFVTERGSTIDDIAANLVSIDDVCAETTKNIGDGGFAGADLSGKADQHR